MITVRSAKESDVERIAQIEGICFPAAEAAGLEQFRERFHAFPENFYVAEDAGEVIGFINGACTDTPSLPDEMYASAALHRKNGAYQTLFGLDVLPEYRRQGAAAKLLQTLLDAAKARGCIGAVLTCKDPMRHYYERFGFVYQGVSASTHGGAKWNDMLLIF